MNTYKCMRCKHTEYLLKSPDFEASLSRTDPRSICIAKLIVSVLTGTSVGKVVTHRCFCDRVRSDDIVYILLHCVARCTRTTKQIARFDSSVFVAYPDLLFRRDRYTSLVFDASRIPPGVVTTESKTPNTFIFGYRT
jgi:hypothetical protein